ncbi:MULTISPECIES: HAMP domain-containing sensor histidine kinase [Paenibacillus]|uniref:HAMP domain-containing sensor histidine kinase n=1 Tax=Paenibacillus TaxID=44249 RepID=UPI002FE39D7A
MKKNTLYRRLVKSHIFSACTLVVTLLVFLGFAMDMERETVELRLSGLLFLLLLFGANVAVYSLWTAKRITGPLEQIAGAMGEMRQGRFEERLDIQATDEFARVERYFNALAESLQQAEAENRHLQESKRRMLVDLSHDLKTPVTSILGYAKALQLEMIDDETDRMKALQLIYNKSIQVASMIDDIFELSKLDSPDFPLRAAPGDLAELLRETVADYYDQFEERKFVLNLDIPAVQVTVAYNAGLLRRAVSNLLSNALRYNPPGTEMTVRLTDFGAMVRLEVIDNGVGISDALKAVIFEPFVRGDSTRKGDGGTGLGLSITKQIMERHGGELRLDNGNGQTSFELVLYRR